MGKANPIEIIMNECNSQVLGYTAPIKNDVSYWEIKFSYTCRKICNVSTNAPELRIEKNGLAYCFFLQ